MPRSDTRRARTSLIVGLSLFLLAQLALVAAFRGDLARWRDPFHHERLARLAERVAASTEPPACVVMIGSSRTYRGFRGDRLERQLAGEPGRSVVAFNLGKEGGGPLMGLFTWQRLCRAGVTPDLLLFEVTPFLWGSDLPFNELGEDVLPAAGLTRDDLAFLARHDPARAEGLHTDWLAGQAIPWLSQRHVLVNRFLPALLPRDHRRAPVPLADDSGDGPYEVRRGSDEARRRAAENAVRHFATHFRGEQPAPRVAAGLRELLDDCRRRGVRVVFVYAPESSGLRRACPPERASQLDNHLAELCRTFGATLVDARAWIGDAAFIDGVHLLPAGADAFTARLGRETVLPLLRTSHCRR